MFVYIEKKLKSIPENILSAFFSSLVFGFAAHYFVIANKLTNHDDIRVTCDELFQVKLGRWFLGCASDLTGNMSLPFDCLLGLIFIGLTAAFTAAALKVRGKITAGLIGAVMATFPMIAFCFIFQYLGDPHPLAILFMAAGAYAAVRAKNRIISIVVPIILFTLSLGIYQGFLGLALGIMILSGISELVYEKALFKKVFLDEVRYALTAGVSAAVYIALTKAIQNVTGTAAADYQGISSMGKINLRDLPLFIRNAYRESLGYYLANSWGIHYGWLTVLMVIVAAGSAVIFIAHIVRERPGRLECALAIVLLAILPVGAGVIYLMGSDGYHLMMIYGFVTIALFPVILADRIEFSAISGAAKAGIKLHEKIFQGAVLLVTCLLVYSYITLDNKVYAVDYYVYEESYSYAQTVASVIRTTPGYKPDTTVCMVGRPASHSKAIDEFYEDDPRLQSFSKAGLDRDFNIDYSMPSFYWYYLGMTNPIQEISIDKAKDIVKGELSVFPEEGSLYAGDGCIVIRFE